MRTWVWVSAEGMATSMPTCKTHADSSTMQLIAAPKHVACHWAGVWSQNASGLGPSVWRVIGMVPEDWPAAVADGGHHLIDFPTYEQPVEESRSRGRPAAKWTPPAG